MEKLVGHEQCGFIPNRSSCDNIIIAQEAIHTMRKKGRRKGYVAIKVDMEKAFDRLDWRFIEDTLVCLGLADNIIRLIMTCISTASMQVLWNGDETESFWPSRGIRQGDPLSPYIFVLCMERLSQLIKADCEIKRWKPLKLTKNGPNISHLFFADDLILFTEASIDQMRHVKHVMSSFCDVSGHRISLAKSKMFCSKNINFNRAIKLSQELGIGLTADLGKYLGVPLFHQRVTQHTFHHIIQRTKRRLSSWKSRHLTMAGRSVLVKSVLASLLSYQMQSMLLPKGIINQLEKISRSFLWSQNEEARKMHLIAWDKIKSDKELGGLGIKDLFTQNKAFIMKLCWGLLTKKNSLWVQCLWSKYKCGMTDIPAVIKRHGASPTWQAIIKVWDQFLSGIGRKINNGRNTSFWWDLWTPLNQPLIAYAHRAHRLNVVDKVADHVSSSGAWRIEKWRGVLPQWIINILVKLKPPSHTFPDCFAWRPANDGCFSVKSAYDFIKNREDVTDINIWNYIWKWKIPEKVKIFMWQVSHERLMTNSWRFKSGISSSSECVYHCDNEESVLHILRDCERARELWHCIVSPNYFSRFFSGNLQVWLRWNAKHSPGGGKCMSYSWSRVFSLACWILWTSRCNYAFSGTVSSTTELLHRCFYLLMESAANDDFNHQIFKIGAAQEDTWTPPPQGTIRIDVDGSVQANQRAACGGVLRNNLGEWIMGFHRSLGVCSVTEAEILAIKNGIEVAVQLGFDKIKIYTDSYDAFNLLMRDLGREHPLQQQIADVRDLLFRREGMEIIKTSRDIIQCADVLAKEGHQGTGDIVLIPFIPTSCIRMYMQDLQFCV